jgi:sporulation protein YabP
VINVESFDEEYLYISTKLGNIGIEGKGLKIESLTKEDGKILITGEIKGIFYYEEKPKRGIGKIFK